MCFSIEADLTVGVALLPVAALSLREVRHVREVPFASLPLLFSVHQLVEALVWGGQSGAIGDDLAAAAALVYVLVALPVLPTLVPLAVLLLEPRGSRRRVVGFVALGAVVSGYLSWVVLSGPVDVVVHPWALEYQVGMSNPTLWVALYIVAVIGPSLLSGYSSIVTFGVFNLVALTAVAVLYSQAFASLWCLFAAVASVLVLVHMVRRRRLPDPHRLHAHPLPVTTP